MRFRDDEEIALPLVRRAAHELHVSGFDDTAWQAGYGRASTDEDEDEDEDEDVDDERRARALGIGRRDRMQPSTAGALVGLLGGAGALGAVHLLERSWLTGEMLRAAEVRQVPFEASVAVAYVTAAACGALVGAVFASVTRHLRRLVPLLVWSLVFFASVALVVLAAMRSYGFDASAQLAPSVFAATAVFAVLAAFSLPLRRARAAR
jgi:hypothetical protein